MKKNLMSPLSALLCLTLLAASCGSDAGDTNAAGDSNGSKPTASNPDGGAADAISKFVLADDPGDAIGVVAAKEAGPAEDVVVHGRVQAITKGFAMLTLIDEELAYCGQVNKEDKCSTPWDYCCDSSEERKRNSVLVELRGADGKPLAVPAIPGVRLLDLLEVTGDLQKDEHGNLVLVADGVYRAERPELPDYVKWPQ